MQARKRASLLQNMSILRKLRLRNFLLGMGMKGAGGVVVTQWGSQIKEVK
jgi:hypothetical protein